MISILKILSVAAIWLIKSSSLPKIYFVDCQRKIFEHLFFWSSAKNFFGNPFFRFYFLFFWRIIAPAVSLALASSLVSSTPSLVQAQILCLFDLWSYLIVKDSLLGSFRFFWIKMTKCTEWYWLPLSFRAPARSTAENKTKVLMIHWKTHNSPICVAKHACSFSPFLFIYEHQN